MGTRSGAPAIASASAYKLTPDRTSHGRPVAASGRTVKSKRAAVSGSQRPQSSPSMRKSPLKAECAVRVREMLADKAFWSDPERKQLLLHRVNQVVDDLFEVAGRSKDSQDYSALIRALDLARKTMSEMEGATEAEMQAMVRLQAESMMDYMDALMRRAREILSEENPDFDPNVIEEAIELARADVRSSD